MKKTIFITGTSSGLGKLTAKYFAEQGWNVAATMRSPERETELNAYENIKIFKLDVTKKDEVETAIADALKTFDKIDVVVNNAGMGTYGALELANEDDIDWQFAVNVRGPINVIRAILPHFREIGGGKIINISSWMGLTTAVPVGSLYNMSKFALEGLTEGLYYELKPLNIDLHLIEQGGSSDNNFQHNITWNTNPSINAYDAIVNKVKEVFANSDRGLDDPMDIVSVIYSLATGENKKFRNVIGKMGNDLLAMRSALPIEQYLENIASNYG
ncbi:SDR family oxidoreductase [Pedobacter duraquae]|uniref:NADP-dependent 3-hydroxy acid dehydrogenase YdfG n=1 Tax=Pedobacter duraquae TaxID=425511 RepID=A0A4R6INK7_9SPHI|nr:SDR family oxidoreductase [Pedobacter duraquae]TDO23839.1 NADP-dependent 3-hydroxy acid dehydrogenase YdfG [Pedobacter duraquae]